MCQNLETYEACDFCFYIVICFDFNNIPDDSMDWRNEQAHMCACI